MTKLNEIYKCNVCGNIVEIAHDGQGTLVCCGQDMMLQPEKFLEAEGNEKHVPVVEKNEEGVTVKVGSVAHPMEEDHFIEWIEIVTEKGISRKRLAPGEEPIVKFPVKANILAVRAYCNKHGLWKDKE